MYIGRNSGTLTIYNYDKNKRNDLLKYLKGKIGSEATDFTFDKDVEHKFRLCLMFKPKSKAC